jgi:hypothetical protein
VSREFVESVPPAYNILVERRFILRKYPGRLGRAGRNGDVTWERAGLTFVAGVERSFVFCSQR